MSQGLNMLLMPVIQISRAVDVDAADIRLRKPELGDVDALFLQKNNSEIADLLCGFSTGYSRADIARWIEVHNGADDEVLYVILGADDRVLGHVGLYQIDRRVRTAEFAILIGDRRAWGKGIGTVCTAWALTYGFDELHLHRIQLEVLATNERAIRLYERLGFVHEGRKRHAQFKAGRYVDVLVMAMLEDEWRQKREIRVECAADAVS